jgi:23S rRNA pseudouridine1911/1915/1917 synthase
LAGKELRRVVFTVGPESAGLRLDAYLASRLPGLSRTRIQEIIDSSLIGPSGRRLKSSSRINDGLRFTLLREAEVEAPLPEIPILYEDDSLVILDKPAGVPVHPAGRYLNHTVTAFLATRFASRPDPAHRLDRETSGVLVCGKGSAATKLLKAAFARGEVDKRYVTLVEGWPKERRFTVDLPLELGQGTVRLRMEVRQGKRAVTDFAVLRRLQTHTGERLALVSARPRTGRQHQIRAHLHAVGFPVVGDKIYGSDERIFLRFIEGQLSDEDRASLRIPRQALHARRVTLIHPIDGGLRSFRSPLPADLAAFMRGLTQGRLSR